MKHAAMRPRDLALALLVIVVWGVNFAVIKVGVVVNLFGTPLLVRWQLKT
jgi:hypothetical protein